jgi:hypothetical protein
MAGPANQANRVDSTLTVAEGDPIRSHFYLHLQDAFLPGTAADAEKSRKNSFRPMGALRVSARSASKAFSILDAAGGVAPGLRAGSAARVP